MVTDVIFEAVLPAIGRMLGYVLIELAFYTVCYITGYVFLKLLTLGKYPTKLIYRGSSDNSDIGVCLVGLLVWIVLITFLLAGIS